MLRQVIVIAVAALVLSVSIAAQTPWQPPRTPDGQPDMQGYWQHTALGAARSIEGDHSRWKGEYGIITAGDPNTVRSTIIIDPPDGKIPYQPWAAAKLVGFRANADSPTTREHIDPFTRGVPVGVPRVNHMPGEMQILQAPGYVVMIFENNGQYRIIPLDRPHVGKDIKLYVGDSRGHWEGNTLVVDVTNQNGRTWFDFISFLGEGLHVVERWTLVSPDRIDFQATLDDPAMFTQPWTLAYRFNRNKENIEIWEELYIEAERDVEHILQGGGLTGRRKE